jgi:AcrR family transcriptional regulator
MNISPKDELIKEEILREAQKLFQQFGLKKTTMEDIAKAMGKGKSTLYYYYCSKEEIFDAVILKEMDEVFNQVKQAVNNAVTAEEKLKMFAVTKIKALQKKSNLYKIVRGELQENMRCMKHMYHAYDQQETKLMKSILSFGLANGEFDRSISKELDLLPSVMVSSLRGIERDMFIGNKYAKMEARIGSIVAILLRGLKKIKYTQPQIVI